MSTSALTTTAPTTTTTTPAPAEPVHEIPQWLKALPVAPEYHPTVAEFQDPIAYILKIENEASQFGICKIVPPVPLPSKKATITNLNRSLSARNPNNNDNNNKSPPTFTTRHQQVGFDPRKGRPVQKPVWQSGESYTLQQFEAKAKQFEKVYLKKSHGKRGSTLSALEIETLFWRASVDKPFSVEYANDMPGSAFVPINTKAMRELGDAATVGETAWNMRGVARSNGSLLRFMKEEIPGVTSPMVYIAMLFSWFAWHVEDHDLHSLNYMHMGAAKTWYGVPRDAAFAFQEVVRVHGYGGDFNPLVTFATLGEKTTVMSPEVLVGGGLPCCRLVQNVGEFVVTFPGAYHSGFSHGFNCGEASNIATPGWLRFAKEAAVRRASINCPPMVSHFQLLYALALTFCSRVPMSLSQEPRSSRLKDKKRGEGERMVKECFLQSVIQNNDLLHILSSHGFSCVLLPQNTSEVSLLSNTCIGTQKKIKPVISVGVGSNTEASEASTVLFSDETKLGTNVRLRSITGFDSVNETSKPVFGGDRVGSLPHHCNVDLSTTVIGSADMEKDTNYQGTGLLDHGRFPCVQCGILSFACVAVIQPREAASQCFMSADCSFFNDWKVGSGFLKDTFSVADENETFEPNCSSGAIKKAYQGGLYDVPVQTSDYQVQVSDEMVDVVSRTGSQKGISSLDLLVSAYGESSESDEELVEPDMVVHDDNIAEHKQFEDRKTFLWKTKVFPGDSRLRSHGSDHQDGMSEYMSDSSSKPGSEDEVSVQISPCTSSFVRKRRWIGSEVKVESHLTSNSSLKIDEETLASRKLKRLVGSYRDKGVFSGRVITGSAKLNETGLCTNQLDSVPVDTRMPSNTLCARPKFSLLGEKTKCSNIDIPIPDTNTSLMQILQEESSRKHIFCLEHAVEVEKQLRPIGGASILLLCHPEYPKVEAEAKVLAEDMGIDYLWKDILFRDATKEDQERISFALDDKEVEPSNGDWAVKLGINLYYSVHLSKSPLYTKQMPYNSIIYKAFRFSSPTNYPMEVEVSGKVPNKQKKTLVAGKWCGKVWMLNQVHPSLAQRETQEEENSSSYHARAVPCLKSCSMLGRKAEMSNQLKEPVNCPTRCSPGVTTTIDGKFGQKQKRKFVEEPTMKRKLPLLGSPAQTEDSSQSDSSPVSGRRCLKKGRPLLQRSSVKNIRQFDSNLKVEIDGGPSTRLRRRPSKLVEEVKVKPVIGKQTRTKVKKTPPSSNDIEDEEAEYQCDIDGCTMGFTSKQELTLHKRNVCSVKGCGKNFFSHKYLVQHRRVHLDDRPLKCPWKGCKMTFKWAWARTEHIRVHTGARPYICREVGCGQTFRFVSDFSRHKRKTGHSVKG